MTGMVYSIDARMCDRLARPMSSLDLHTVDSIYHRKQRSIHHSLVSIRTIASSYPMRSSIFDFSIGLQNMSNIDLTEGVANVRVA